MYHFFSTADSRKRLKNVIIYIYMYIQEEEMGVECNGELEPVHGYRTEAGNGRKFRSSSVTKKGALCLANSRMHKEYNELGRHSFIQLHHQ